MAFCNYGPAGWFTARFHSSMSGVAELCAASINCAHHSRTYRSSASPHPDTLFAHNQMPRSFLPYDSPATHPLLSLALTQDHNSIQSP